MLSWLKMGVKDSKQFSLLYEDVVKRVTEGELKRLREAFKKSSSGNGVITKLCFVKDVLGDVVPLQIAEIIYVCCGGTSKGITFRDLLCGLVLLTRGTKEEKIKFLFGVYSNDSGTVVIKEEFQKMVQCNETPCSVETIYHLFHDRDSVGLDAFRDWLITYPDSTSLTRWLMADSCSVSLSNDLETPTFYQTLCGVTHLEEFEMIELEKRYWALKNSSRSGKLDLETLAPLLSPALTNTVCQALFNAFDENEDNHVDFKEMACGVSAACRGPAVERHKFCFKVFDMDKDGFLKDSELNHMVETLVRESALPAGCDFEETKRGVKEELASHMSTPGAGLAMGEFLIWAVASHWPHEFLNLLFQICHIVLALHPATPREEGEVVMAWLRREEERGLQVGQFWYLVDTGWWRQWQLYTACVPLTEEEQTSPAHLDKVASATLKIYTGIEIHCPGGSPRVERRYAQSSPPQRPGPIDNTGLLQVSTAKVTSLTGEGGKLRKNLIVAGNKDVQVVPQSLWTVLTLWYGGQPALPRQVIMPTTGSNVELELYPVNLRFLKHVTRTQQTNNWTGMVGGYGASTIGTTGYAYVSSLTPTPKRYLAYVGAFSRLATLRQVYQYLCNKLRIRVDDVRLWLYRDESNMFILEEEESSMEVLGVMDDDQILIEMRNKDLTWPEELNNIQNLDKSKQGAVERGATGLNNLGNTCFMNAALQCVSNTHALTQYFTSHMHLYELNRDNPLGMKGHIALRYGDLIQSIWSGCSKTIAPLKFRWTIGKYAPRFNGFEQHDSQELLAFLLDGLHEDLNRVHVKPYLELQDSEGRPDVIVAQEAWENHILRNKSIIVDLFHGQLKSKITCNVCSHEKVRFDPFTYLSLPLPMENYLHLTVTVMKLDGSVPVKYGLRLNNEERYLAVKTMLSPLCAIPAHLIKLVEVQASVFKHVFLDDQRIRGSNGCHVYAYELPPCCQLSMEEEKLSISSNRSQSERDREASAFTAIQRSTVPASSAPTATITDGGGNTGAWSLRGGGGGAGVNEMGDACAEMDQSEVRSTRGSSFLRCMPVTLFCSKQSTSHTHNSLLSSESSSLTSLGTAQQYGVVEGCVPYSSAHSSSSGSIANLSDTSSSGFIIGLHRKMIRQESYFLSSSKTKPSLFGLPVIVPCNDSTTHQDLYQSVWQQVARLVSPLPPSDTANHAMDCDDSLGYEFPFMLKAVNRHGTSCAWCPWYYFCTGCRIQCCLSELAHTTQYLSIDWDPTALHLRYQTCLERVVVEHESVQRTRQLMSDPIGLDHCLETFTRQETLSEDEKVYCTRCKSHENATKKLQIWRLPPILIVHLKRFQFVNGKWVKSQKVVDFPVQQFDPTAYLASVPKETVLRHRDLVGDQARTGVKVKIKTKYGPAVNNNTEQEEERCSQKGCDRLINGQCEEEAKPSGRRRDRLESTSLLTTPIEDEALQDFHQHRLNPGVDPFHLKYNLYSVVCHSGMLDGGHYVSFACNPRGVWYCYNDSSCKHVSSHQMDLTSAYMLFYERQGLGYSQYMPNVAGREKDSQGLDEDSEMDLKKLCTLQ